MNEHHILCMRFKGNTVIIKHMNHWTNRYRFKREHLSEAASHLTLKPMPEAHKKVNSNSFIETVLNVRHLFQ
jgi:hypothetical protein